MGVAFAGAEGWVTYGGTSWSTSRTTPSGSDRYLMVQYADVSRGNFPTSYSYAGAGFTHLYDHDHRYLGLVAPATGANTLVLSFAGYQSGNIVIATAWTGVDQTTPTNAQTTATGSSSSSSTGSITCPADGVIIGGSYSGYTTTGNPSITAGTAIDQSRWGGGGQTRAEGYRLSTGALSWTLPSSASWYASGIPLNAAAAAGGVPTRPVTILDAVHRASNW